MAALILFAALAAAMPADHDGPLPSFDCRRATSHVELMICGDAILSGMDRGIALFYASGRRNARPARVIREQADWVARTRDQCQGAACLRQQMSERLWQLSEGVGPDLPSYSDEDADGELVIAELGGGWYAFGAVGYWHGPTENSAAAGGAFHLDGDRGSITPDDLNCAFSLNRLANDRWRITAHPQGDTASCGGMNATVEGTYSRRRGHR